MCSIAGFQAFGKPVTKDFAKDLSMAMLYYGQERGDQSAGIFVQYADKTTALLKRAIHPSELIDLPEFTKLFTKPVKIALIHTRAPTSGGRDDPQAQPFCGKSCITIHNGWYHNIEELKSTWGLLKPSGVDSELLTSFVDQYGVKMLPKFFKDAWGSSAAAIWHRDNLYLIRDSNPLVMCRLQTTNGRNLFTFASTYKQLSKSIWRVLLAYDLEQESLDDDIIVRVTPKRLKTVGKIEQSFGIGQYWNNKFYDYEDMPSNNGYYNAPDLSPGGEQCGICHKLIYTRWKSVWINGRRICTDCWEAS